MFYQKYPAFLVHRMQIAVIKKGPYLSLKYSAPFRVGQWHRKSSCWQSVTDIGRSKLLASSYLSRCDIIQLFESVFCNYLKNYNHDRPYVALFVVHKFILCDHCLREQKRNNLTANWESVYQEKRSITLSKIDSIMHRKVGRKERSELPLRRCLPSYLSYDSSNIKSTIKICIKHGGQYGG